MVDVLLPPTTSATATASPVNASGSGLTAVQVEITDLTQALQDLTRTIQVGAVAIASTDGSAVTLSTVMGDITVALAQQLSAADKQNLTQQLMNLLQTQKPLTLTLQAGSPPTQGTLLIPTTAAQPQAPTQPIQQNAAPSPQTPQPLIQPLSAGQELPAIVLSAPASQPSVPLVTLPTLPLPTIAPFATPQVATPPLATTPPTASVPSATPQPTAATGTTTATETASSAPTQTNNAVIQTGAALLPQILASYAVQKYAPTQQATPINFLPQQTPIPTLPPNAQQPQQQTAPAPPATMPLTAQLQESEVQHIPLAPIAPQAVTPAPPLSSPPIAAQPQTLSPQVTALLRPGNEVTLHIDAVLPPVPNTGTTPLPAQPLPTPLAANQLEATVTGTGTNGQLILKAEDTTLFVKAPVSAQTGTQLSAPVGTTVIVTVTPLKTAPLLPLPTTPPANFPALPQALATIAQSNPLLFQQLTATHLPQPTEALPGALLLLFSAFKQGNVRGWLGDEVVDTLRQQGKTEIINSLSQELSDAGQPVQDPVVGEWRAYPIPLYAQQNFQALTLYVHSDRDARKDQTSAPKGAGKIRFLIDMRLTKLGALQVDGFVRPKKLDMILRSETLLPQGLHHELRGAYIKAMGAVGYTGTLNFQVGRHHWMTMQRPTQQGIVT